MKNRILTLFLSLFITLPLVAAGDPMSDLGSSDPELQMEACRQLGVAQNENAIPQLIQLLQNSGDKNVAATAAAALGAIGKAGPATQALLQAANESNDSRVQYAAILALANLNDGDNKDAILSALDHVQNNTGDDMVKDVAVKLKPIISNQ